MFLSLCVLYYFTHTARERERQSKKVCSSKAYSGAQLDGLLLLNSAICRLLLDKDDDTWKRVLFLLFATIFPDLRLVMITRWI